MNDYIYTLTMIVVIFCSSVITVYLVPFLKEKVRSTQYGEVIETVAREVLAAEQIVLGKGMGEKKKKFVMAAVRTFADSIGIKITDDQISSLIEAAVRQMNASSATKKVEA